MSYREIKHKVDQSTYILKVSLLRLELNLFRSLRHPIKLRDLKGESSQQALSHTYLRNKS